MRASVLGNGVYSAAEAARILGVTRSRVAAWFTGWPRRARPIFASDYRGLFHELTISFLDFVDTAVAVTLREKHGVSQATIRRLRDSLGEKWKTPHPFSREEFYTDDAGREIFCTVADPNGEARLLEILKNQLAMSEVLLPFLKRVTYNHETRFAQVFNLTDRVVLDPRRKYGKPTVRGTGMPTVILYECFRATGSVDSVADWYNVAPEDVEAAISFETQFSGIAA